MILVGHWEIKRWMRDCWRTMDSFLHAYGQSEGCFFHQWKITFCLRLYLSFLWKHSLTYAWCVGLQEAGTIFNPIKDGPLQGCSWMGGAKMPTLPKICHTYPTMMKFGTVIPHLKKIQKIYKLRDTSFSSADISIFSPEISKLCYIKKYIYRLRFDT